MKIFYKKDFQRVLEKKIELEQEFEQYKTDTGNCISALEDQSMELLMENSELKDSKLKTENVKKEYEDKVKTLKLSLDETKLELKDAIKEKKSLEKEKTKLEKDKSNLEDEIAILKAKIADLESDRYLIRKIPAGRTKNVNKTSIRSSAKESRAIKYVKDNL